MLEKYGLITALTTQGQNLSHSFTLALNFLSKEYHCLWCNLPSLNKNWRIYPTPPSVYGAGYGFDAFYLSFAVETHLMAPGSAQAFQQVHQL